MAPMENEKIFSFDIGTGSLGTCIRKGNEIELLDVETLPSDFATVKEARERRRQIRTRIAHKKREEWWKEHAQKAGIEVLETGHLNEKGEYIKPDPRLTREFQKKGDPTIYNSLLLRIALLHGEKLEGWQIYKAIWSAIQRRGYDINLPWKSKIKEAKEEDNEEQQSDKKRKKREKKANDKKNDEKEIEEAVQKYKEEMKKCFGEKQEFYYPSFFDAFRLGIWDPDDPENYSKTIDENAKPIRNKYGEISTIAPAEMVDKELKQLLVQAGKQYPYIEKNLNYILYGPTGCKYGAYLLKDYRKYMGRDIEWQGLLSQKTPRFDNRIVYKCRLIPRLNVCKRKDPLCKEITFLMKLKNFRYVEAETGVEKSLTPKEISELFEEHKNNFKITESKLKKYLQKKLNGIVHPSFKTIEAPKEKGRASFCRPAMKIIKDIILSGKSPHELYQEYISNNQNTDPKKGLINEDYKFLLAMPDSWDKFHIPDTREEEAQLNEEERIKKIHEIFSKISNPVVRHRLLLFYQKLQKIKEKFDEPDKIVLEFARVPENTIAGKKKKEQIMKQQKENEKINKQVRDKLNDLKEQGVQIEGKKAFLKLKLWMDQGGKDIYQHARDPYSETNIPATEINNCEIDHIVPREKGGPDAYYNLVLTSRANNQAKGKQTPYEWLGKDITQWNKFIDYISSFNKSEKNKGDKKTDKFGLPKKKIRLLISDNPEELLEKYTHLAETAYISRLAQKICHLFFGWEQLTKGSERKVFVVTGNFTSRIRNIFELNQILEGEETNEEDSNSETNDQDESTDSKQNKKKKNRDNPRHHALDSLIISITPEIKFNPEKGKDEYPTWFNKDFCIEKLEKCLPLKIRFVKPKLAETIYGLRKYIDDNGKITNDYVFVTRFGTGTNFDDYKKIDIARKHVKDIYSYNIRKDLEEELAKNPTKEEWEIFLHNYRAGGKPKKLLLIEGKKIKSEDVEKFLKGEINNLGEFIKGKMPGQYLKQKKESHGYFVVKNNKGKWERIPIYVFESPYKKKKEIISKFGNSNIIFLKTGILVKLNENIYVKEKERLKKGYYYINTIRDDNFCQLTSIDGKTSDVISINILLEQGKLEIIQQLL